MQEIGPAPAPISRSRKVISEAQKTMFTHTRNTIGIQGAWRPLALLVSILLTLGPLNAAERMVRTIYYRGAEEAPRKAFLYGLSGKYIEVPFPRSNISDAMKLPDGGGEFILMPKILAEGEEFPTDAPRVLIPTNWDLTALLISPDPANKQFPIRAQPVNASPSVFGPGEMLWINLSQITVGGQIGNRKLLLKPDTSELMKSPATEGGDYPVYIDCVVPGERKLRWLVRQTWRHLPTARQLVFVQPLPPPQIATLHSVAFYD